MNNRRPDEIENRLKAMRPVEPSRALRERLAASLGASSQTKARHQRQGFAIGAVALAAVWALAGVVSVLLVLEADPPRVPGASEQPEMIAELPEPGSADHPVQDPAERQQDALTGPPTLIELTRAWRDSPQAFDDLLDASINRNASQSSSAPPPTLALAGARRWIQNHKELP